MIRSRFDFGCYLYGNSAKTHLAKIDRIQNQALRIIGGFIKSSPIHVMECELCIPPLFLRRLFLAYKFCIKSMSWTENVTTILLNKLESTNMRYWQSKNKPLLLVTYPDCKQLGIHNSHQLEMFKLDVWVSYIDVNTIIRDNLDCVKTGKHTLEINLLKVSIIKELNLKYSGWSHIYTDGSKSDKGLGAAFCDINKRISATFQIDVKTSIMTMELIAISKALDYILESLDGQHFVIITDSKSALQHLARCASGSSRGVPIAFKILSQLYIFQIRKINLRLQWVPSHIGLYGNEEADRLAKLAITVGTKITYFPFYSETLNEFKILCFHKFKEYFDERSKEKGIWY